MKFITLTALLATAVAVASAALPAQPEGAFVLSQEEQKVIHHRKPVFADSPMSYIVVFKDSTTADIIKKAEQDILERGGQILQHYNSVFKGFAALMPSDTMEVLSGNPFIDFIELDSQVSAL